MKTIHNLVDLLFYAQHFALYVFAAIVSILLGILKVGINFGAPGFFYGLLGPLCYFHATWFEKKHRNILS